MDKPQFLVIGILAVALGFFALRFTSDDSNDFGSSYGSGGTEYAMSDFGEDGRGEFGRGGDRMGRDRGTSGGRTSRLGSGGARIGSTTGSRGGAEVVKGGMRGERRRRGAIGGGSGGTGGIRPSGQLGRTGSGPDANSLKRDRDRSGSSRLDVLSGAESKVDPFYEEGLVPDENDVVLDVSSKEDADTKGQVVDGVEDSDDGEWLEIGEDSVMTFPNGVNQKAGTISMDIVPNWNGADSTDNSLLQMREAHQWENRIQVVKNGQFLRFIVTDNTGHEADISHRITSWEQGDAHRITATWDNGKTILWVDGKQVGSNTYPGTLEFNDNTPMHVGSDHASGAYAGLDGKAKVKLYSSAKGPDDII